MQFSPEQITSVDLRAFCSALAPGRESQTGHLEPAKDQPEAPVRLDVKKKPDRI